MSFAIFEATHVLVAGSLFDVCTLPVADIFDPVAVVGVASGIVKFSLSVTSAENEVSLIDHASTGYVGAFAVVVTLEEVTTVIVICEGGFDGLGSGEALDRVIARICPQVMNQTVRAGK